MRSSKVNVFLSNKLEELVACLKGQLFEARPFTAPLVIVPNQAVKSFLYSSCVEDPNLGIASGMEITTLGSFVSKNSPTSLELSLRLEQEILLILENREAHPNFNSLFNYLEGQEIHLSQFCDRLSLTFLRYRLYGDLALKEWQKEEGWQQELWRKVMSEDLYLMFNAGRCLHVFGFSFLPKIYLSALQQREALFYFLSPCEYFWGDLYSDKELKRMHRRKLFLGLELEGNRLLANWGILGRQLASSLETEGYLSEECYVETEGSLLLETLQNDLLKLSEESLVSEVSTLDRSMQLHSVPSKFREVEVLLEVLYGEIERAHREGDPICPKDILILVPDLESYIPYIRAVFGNLDNSLKVLCKEEDAIFEPLFHILSLPKERFEADFCLKLLTYPSILMKFSFTEEMVEQMTHWTKAMHVLWGMNAAQKSDLLGEELLEKSDAGTWQDALDRLLEGLIKLPSEENVEWVDAELLGKFAFFLTSLSADLEPIIQKKKFTLSEWVSFVITLAEKYLSVQEQHLLKFRELLLLTRKIKQMAKVPYDSFERVLKHFFSQKKERLSPSLEGMRWESLESGVAPAKIICLLGMSADQFPRKEEILNLCELTKRKGFGYAPSRGDEDRNALLEVLLSARKSLIVIYSRIDSADGKEQEVSPLIQELFSYLERKAGSSDCIGIKPFCFSHSLLAFDKSYFAPQTFTLFSPQYYKQAEAFYLLDQKSEKMPFINFQKRAMFTFTGRISAMREAPDVAALDEGIASAISEEKDAADGCLAAGRKLTEKMNMAQKEHFTEKRSTPLPVSLKNLSALAKHPIKFYFQEVLQIYFSAEEAERETSEFVLDSLQRGLAKKQTLYKPFKEVIQDVESKLPLGAFKQIAIDRIEEDHSAISRAMQNLNISSDRLFSVEFRLDCEEPYSEDPRNYFLPALPLQLKTGKQLLLHGKLSDLSEEGLIIYGEGTLADVVKQWPSFLLLPLIKLEGKTVPQVLLFAKSGKKWGAALPDSLESLKIYLEYYFYALQHPSPLMPDWTQAFLEGADPLDKAITKTFAPYQAFEDPYLTWLEKRDPPLEARILYEDWSAYCQKLFPKKMLVSHTH